MALPKINTPTFELILPSTGEQVRYRPFLVKEQKILLMALESQENGEMLRAIKQIITNCCLKEDFKVDKLPMFDIEYFFLKLRAKSIGEEVELNLGHFNDTNRRMDECKHRTKYKINLMDIEVTRDDEHSPDILISENPKVGVVLKYPTMSVANRLQNANAKNQMEVITDVVIESIDYIYDAENTYPASEQTKQELSAFINDLSQEQFAKISAFFNTMPKLKKTISWHCEGCGQDDEVTLEGMASFFG
jgi:hypothetical protein